MASSSNLPGSPLYDAWLAPQEPATTTQHLEMDTPLPSIELPVEDLTEGPDLAGCRATQNSSDSSFNDCMEGRQRPHESHLNSAAAASPPPTLDFIDFSDDWHTSGINGLPPTHEDIVQLATPNPILDWYTSEKKPWDSIPSTPWPLDDEEMYLTDETLRKRRKEHWDRDQWREAIFQEKFGSCFECRRTKEVCQPWHHGIRWDELDIFHSQPIRSSTKTDTVPSFAGNPDQHSYAPIHEGTVADSGYVSACASWPHHEMKPHEQLINHGTMTQPQGQKGPQYDQQTVYTSMELPHGSGYITDLCNDIYLNLKHEIQEHTQDQDRIELPKCLPDLVKALSFRIGLDKSNPASPHVMHFLHVRYK